MRTDKIVLSPQLLGIVATALAGCTLGPNFQPPAPVPDRTYTPTALPQTTAQSPGPGGSAQHLVQVDTVGGAWWEAFQSPDLNSLVAQALSDSPTLAEARARLEQARQDLRAQSGGLDWPQVNASMGVTREKTNPAAFGIGGILGDRTFPPFTVLEGQVSVSYSLDLFGGTRRTLEGLAAQVDYEQYELEAARLALAGNVVTAVIHRASLASQLSVSERLLENQTTQLGITQERYRAGGLAENDLLAEQSLVEQTRAQLPALRTQLAQSDHQLAVYLGRTPAQGIPAAPQLDALTLPAELPVTLPSTLAQQRPDVRASGALLHQASANVGVATANLFPKFTLTASGGPEGTAVSNLVEVWSVGAGLTQPLFHGGELRARLHAARAAYDAAAANYRGTVLTALQQVSDALHALGGDADALVARDAAQRAAARAARVAEQRYQAGGLSELAMRDAQNQELRTTLDRSTAQAQRLSDTAALFLALGARP